MPHAPALKNECRLYERAEPVSPRKGSPLSESAVLCGIHFRAFESAPIRTRFLRNSSPANSSVRHTLSLGAESCWFTIALSRFVQSRFSINFVIDITGMRLYITLRLLGVWGALQGVLVPIFLTFPKQ